MKKILKLSETDIKAVIAEKFKTDPSDISIEICASYSGEPPYEMVETVIISVESEVQNYDL